MPLRLWRALQWVTACVLALTAMPARAHSQQVRVAVAANFADVQAQLVELFERRSGYDVVTSTGSTGQLYAQIRNGAPYEVFMAADAERPRLLERDSLAVTGTRFVYAEGRLALYGPGLDSVRAGGLDLRAARHRRIAIANPVTSPYGAAALQVMERLGVRERLANRLVRGESIAQTFQFVETRAASLGFVAYAQVRARPSRTYWLVPAAYHDPIAQEAVLLKAGENNPAARAWIEFLRSDVARRIIESWGYAVR